MDAVLKQRLIGASVIIALAIIFVPLLFNNEPPEGAESFNIQIPDKPNVHLETKKIAIDVSEVVNSNSKADLPLAELEVVEEDQQPPKLELIKPEKDKPEHSNKTDSQLAKTNVSKDAGSAPIEKNVKVDSAVSTELDKPIKNEDKQNEVKNEDSPVAHVDQSQKKPGDKGNVGSNSAYRIKLGSFSQRGNAEKLKASLLQKGISSIVAASNDKKLYRVWSKENYNSTESAERYVNQVKSLKLNIGEPKIIGLTAQEVSNIRSSGALGWVIQLGSFSKKQNAFDFRNRLKLQDIKAFVDMVNHSGQTQKMYRVRIGPYLEKNDAESVNRTIKDKFKVEGIIKEHDSAPVVNE